MVGSLFHPSTYGGIFLFLVLTGCGLPIPEEVAIVIAGVLSSEGHLRPELALAACLCGAVVGDCLLYAIGFRWGTSLFAAHPALARLLHAQREPRFEQAVDRHGLKVMLLSRFLVGIRGPAYLAAGAVQIPIRRFLLYDLLSAGLVVGTVFGLSYVFGDDIAGWVRRAEWTVTLLVVLVLLTVGGLLYLGQRRLILTAIFGRDTTPDR